MRLIALDLSTFYTPPCSSEPTTELDGLLSLSGKDELRNLHRLMSECTTIDFYYVPWRQLPQVMSHSMDLIPCHISDYAREEPEAAFEAPPGDFDCSASRHRRGECLSSYSVTSTFSKTHRNLWQVKKRE